MRNIALGLEARSRGVAVKFATVRDDAVVALLEKYGLTGVIVSEPQEVSWLHEVRPPDVVVIDGYHLGEGLAASARARGAVVCVIDDLGTGRYEVDVLLNQNTTGPFEYHLGRGTRLLAGPSYALVRSEFARARNTVLPGRANLLVVLGGADVAQIGPTIVEAACASAAFERVTLLQGPLASTSPEDVVGVDIIRDPTDVAAVFSSANAAVAAAGSTVWELLCVGVPTALIQVADNQAGVIQYALSRQAVRYLGNCSDLRASSVALRAGIGKLADQRVQAELATGGMRLVDGRGAARVLDVLLDIAGVSGSGPIT
jgi:spore coat polysaccharide biosynthesis predicted glycosyltransferase SpsG